MSTATITAKGQITIPKDIRQALNLKSQDRVIFVVEGERAILIPARRRSIMKLRGTLPSPIPFADHQQIRQEVRRKRGEMLTQEATK
jgi:antitoxin PrlF